MSSSQEDIILNRHMQQKALKNFLVMNYWLEWISNWHGASWDKGIQVCIKKSLGS